MVRFLRTLSFVLLTVAFGGVILSVRRSLDGDEWQALTYAVGVMFLVLVSLVAMDFSYHDCFHSKKDNHGRK